MTIGNADGHDHGGTRPMKILFVAWRDLANKLAGGSEVLIDTLAAGLTERGHDVTLLAANPVEPRAYEIRANGGTVSQYARAPFEYLRSFRDVDLVVDVANGLSFYSPLWRRKPSICFVNHIHTEQWNQWFPAPLAAIGKTLEQRAMPTVYRNRLFVAVSPSTAEGLEDIGVDRDRIRIIINGTHVPDDVGVEADEPLFVGLGRLVPHKRFELALEAWEKVRPHTGGRLVIAGQGPDRKKLLAAAGPGAEIPGRITEQEKGDLLAQAWLLVHPASHEGWGLVITEAAAYGTPSLAFRVPGLRDSVVDGMSGILVDHPDDFAATWRRIAEDPVLRARLREGARSRALACSWERTVTTFEEICVEAVEAPSHGLRLPRSSWAKDHRPAVAEVGAVRPEEAGIPHGTGRPRLEVVRDRPELSIVIPAFDEALRLPVAMPVLFEHLRTEGLDAEILLVDDGSSDETVAVAEKLFAAVPRAGVLRLDRHLGKGAAVRAGVAEANGRQIVFLDADMATDLAHLEQLLEKLDHTAVSIGSRSAPGAVTNGMTPSSDAAHRSFNALARRMTGLSIMDFQCGFKAFRAPAAKLLFHLLHEPGWAFDVELLALADRIGYGISEVPVHWKAVRGSHVRIVADSLLMFWQVARIARRIRRVQSITTLEFDGHDSSLGAVHLAERARSALPIAGPVVPWNEGALALLPFVDPADARTLRGELEAAMGDVSVTASALDTTELFESDRTHLRDALAMT